MKDKNTILISQELQGFASSVNDLSQMIHQNNRSKGFWEGERNVGEMLMLVVSELGEAIEAHRKNTFTRLSPEEKKEMDAHCFAEYFQEHIKNTFEDEIADTMIRLLDLSAGLGIDIGWHIKQKVAYNTSRAYKHGKQY